MNLSNIVVIKDILGRHGFTFSKALGQNFLINPSVCPRMAEEGGARAGVGVIEIGGGVGVLTCELASVAEKVVCIEIDERLMPVLKETLTGYNNVKLINNDVLKVDLAKLIEEEFAGMDVYVCANLPYYITSPIIMHLLEQRLNIKAITVMVQKEAAIRLCANPGTREVGAVSIAVRYYSEPRRLFEVDRGSFMPSPDVDSTVIRLDILSEPPVKIDNDKMFFKVVKGAFSQRRKTIHNAISSFFGMDKQSLLEVLERCDIKPNMRAEQLSMEDFASISNEIAKSF